MIGIRLGLPRRVSWLLITCLLSMPVAAQTPTASSTATAATVPEAAPTPAPDMATPAATAESIAPSGPVVDTLVITASPAATQPVPTTPASTAQQQPAAPPSPPSPPAMRRASSGMGEGMVSQPRVGAPVHSPWWFFATIDHRWSTSPAFDLYGDNDVTQFYGLAVGYDVLTLHDETSLTRRDTLALNVELGWNTGGSARDDFAHTFSRSELFTHNMQAAISGRYELLPWLAPHARLSLGLSVVDMTLQSDQDNVTYKDELIAPMLGLSVGVTLQTAPRALSSPDGELASLRLGVRAELGYTFASEAGFALKADDHVRVPVTESSLGGLPRSGPAIHTAVFVRL